MVDTFSYDTLFSEGSTDTPLNPGLHAKYDFATAYPAPETASGPGPLSPRCGVRRRRPVAALLSSLGLKWSFYSAEPFIALPAPPPPPPLPPPTLLPRRSGLRVLQDLQDPVAVRCGTVLVKQ